MNTLTTGFLSPITERVVLDKDLDLEIRDNYLNIYYIGNSLLNLSEKTSEDYRVTIRPHRLLLEPHLPAEGGYRSVMPDGSQICFEYRYPGVDQQLLRYYNVIKPDPASRAEKTPGYTMSQDLFQALNFWSKPVQCM